MVGEIIQLLQAGQLPVNKMLPHHSSSPLLGSGGQEVVFDPLRLISQCSQGLRNGTDKFTFTGTVGKNFSALIRSGWSTHIIVEIFSSEYKTQCDILFGTDGLLCDPLSTEACHCDRVNSTTGSVHFIVNRPALLDYSEATIRALWLNTNGPVVYSNTITLPKIYDVKRANLTLKVNGVAAKQVSHPLGVNFESSKSNSVQLCCTNSASPCYPRITLNGQVFESHTGNCVSHTVFVPNVNYKANVTSSYSVCTKTDYITAGSGVIKTVQQSTTKVTTFKPRTSTATAPGTTEVTTAIPSTSSETASGSKSSPDRQKDDTVLIVSLSVIIPIALCICMFAVASHFMKTPNRTQAAVTNDGTNKTEADEPNKENQN